MQENTSETAKENEALVDDLPAENEEAQETTEQAAAAEELDPWEQLEQEAAQWKDKAVRATAELENFRKRMAREKQDAVRYGNMRLLEELLPVLDNFNMGMMAAEKEQGSMLYMGMNMVLQQIESFLASQNVEEIVVADGAEFDPKIHEGLLQEASDSVEKGHIIRTVRKGYKVGERLLRPTNVAVSTGPAEESPAEDTEKSE